MKPILTALACLAVLHVTATNADAQQQNEVDYEFIMQPALGVNTFPLGGATLMDVADEVLVGNIGTSGQDGVEFDVRLPGLQTIGTFMDWQWWDPDGSLPLGAMFQSEVIGTINGIADQRIGTWRMTKTDAASYESTLDLSRLGVSTMDIVLLQEDGTEIGRIEDAPRAAELVMQVDFDALDSEEPFQQAWVFEEGTDATGSEIKRWKFVNGWPSKLSEVGLRSEGELVQVIPTDPSEPVVVETVTIAVEEIDVEITTLRLTFANIPEFQVRGLQLLVVPEPSGIVLVLSGLAAGGYGCRRRRLA